MQMVSTLILNSVVHNQQHTRKACVGGHALLTRTNEGWIECMLYLCMLTTNSKALLARCSCHFVLVKPKPRTRANNKLRGTTRCSCHFVLIKQKPRTRSIKGRCSIAIKGRPHQSHLTWKTRVQRGKISSRTEAPINRSHNKRFYASLGEE